ncbi:MAG: two-component regulator propeller domain-containing protein [Bacteroidota bacterium]|nr:two-component regulator propeller domain-containing protein [Bacteroidota bacterium]
MRNRLTLPAILICLSAGGLFAQAPQLAFSHILDEQGLSNSTIEAIYQDSKGFIWFGTRDGLNRYDGKEIVAYKYDPSDSTSLSDSYIRYLYEDRYHDLWVATINGLNRFVREKNHFIRYKHVVSDPYSLSSNLITSMTEDRDGNLWIGTFGGGLDRFDRGTGHFIAFRHDPNSAGSLGDDRVNYVYKDKGNNLWIGTESGLDLLTKRTGPFITWHYTSDVHISRNTIRVIQEDRQGNLWLGTEDEGLFLFDPLQKTFTRFRHSDKDPSSLGNDMIKSLLFDRKGNLWVGTINGGLNLFNPARNSFYQYQNEPGNSSSLSQRTVSALFEDNQGNLWIGTHRGGVNVYSAGMEKFHLYRQQSVAGSLSYSDVRAFCEDNDGIWIGTDGGGLDLFQRDRNSFQHFRNDPFRENSIGSDAVLHILKDREGGIWVSTWGGGLNLLDKKTGAFTRYRNNPSDSTSISSDYVQQTYEDFKGNLWVATYYGGLNLFDRKKKKFTRLIYDSLHQTSLYGNNIVSICEDRESNIWIGTDDGGLNCYHQTTRHFTHYFNNEDKMPDLRVIFSDSRGRLWVGQKGLYLFDPAGNRFTLYTDKAGLSTEFIKGITDDQDGNLWIATSNGLTQFNPETFAYKKYNTGDGLQGLEFEANAYMKAKDGEMFFGGINGFNCFYPGDIRINTFIPPVYLTGFQIFNEPVIPGRANSPLQNDISFTDEVRLSYKQSTFSFNFAALNYTAPENNQYAYKLEPFDKDWNYVGKERKANYTNIGPGEYHFRVKASNNDGVWNEEGTGLRIVITPPYWKTSWFVLLISAIVIACLYAFYKFKTRLKLKELEERKREEIHQVQLQFFTNISHEFRTPLSLILGPLERLMKEDAGPAFRHYYSVMHRNIHRLMGLITELMDFRKLESGSLRLHVTKGNLNGFLEEIAEEFRDWALQKEILFRTILSHQGQDTWFDRQILEKIVLNLLNNSIKYTKKGGHITLSLFGSLADFKPSHANELVLKNEFRGSAYAYIRVADNGIGISKESIRHLFERYYRITESHLGSGVGLAFVKNLAILHKGDVLVYSERGEGTEIIIGIPVSEQDYKKEEKSSAYQASGGVRLESLHNKYEHYLDEFDDLPAGDPREPEAAAATELILLVEDNAELRGFLRDTLSKTWKVVEAADGKEGFMLARQTFPNLIISDIIMPGMNGIELCRAIREDPETAHTPFVMLTARSAVESQVEGLESGADHYFAKPLNIDLLLLTIRNIFDQGTKRKERFGRDSHIEAMEQVHSEKDKEFIGQVLAIIESQLSNPDFSVDYLCGKVGMSRTKLYQKIKDISGQSIGDFVRTIRLKKAVQIMTHEDVPLSEVMYRIGIQTQSYFTKAFKKEFGKTPTQFMQEIKKY